MEAVGVCWAFMNGKRRMEKKMKMLFALTLAALAVVACALIMFDDEDSVAADVTHVSTIDQFSEAIDHENFNIVLDASFSVKDQITVKNSGTIDFNGNIISSSYIASNGATGDVRFSLVLKGDVTLKNGTYKGPTSDLNDTRGIVSYGNLTIEKMVIDAKGINVCQYGGEKAVKISGSTISGAYAVSTFNNNITVAIDGSKLTGTDCGLYHNGSYCGYKATVSNTTISGSDDGIYVSGSTTTTSNNGGKNQQLILNNCKITGGTGVEGKFTDITLNDCEVISTANVASFVQYNNGSTTAGFAVVSTDNTMEPNVPELTAKVTINGGIYKGLIGLSSFYCCYTTEMKLPDSFQEATYEINGGSFNDLFGAIKYAKFGATITLADDITITSHDAKKYGLNITKPVEIIGNGHTICFTNKDTECGLVFSGSCGGSKLSNVTLNFGECARYGLCFRNMSEGSGVTIENVTIDGYGKTGIDINGVCGEIKLKGVVVNGIGYYAKHEPNITEGYGYALVIDNIKADAKVTTENCTIASVNIHNFCGNVHSINLAGCKNLLFVSVEDASKTSVTSVNDDKIAENNKKQNNGSIIGNTIIGDDGLLKAGIVTFPNDEITKKYAIFDTTKSKAIESVSTDKKGSFECLRAYRVCYGLAFFDANVNIVKDYTINCDIWIPEGVSVLVDEGVNLTIAKDSTLTGTISGPVNNKLTANGMKAGEGGITITGGSLIINGKIMDAGGSEAGVTVTVSGEAIKINGSLEAGATMVIEEGTVVTVENGKTFLSNGTVNNNGVIDNKGTITNDGVLTNNGTIKMTGESNIAGGKKVVNNGIVIDERAKNASAVPVTNDGTVVAKNNADKYKEAKVDVVEQDPDKPVATEGKIEVNTNKYAFITPITTTGKLDIVLNDGYKQYTVTIPEGTVIAAGTVISVSFIEYQSDSVTRYQINTPGIENFSMKLPCQIGFKKAKVYCDDSELGVSKVRYDAGTGYVTFDASHNSVFTIVLSNTSHAGTTTVSGGDAANDYSLVIAITVLVASLGFLAYVIKKR